MTDVDAAAPTGVEPRAADVVMRPEILGAARSTRYSFSRTMLRRAAADGWTARRVRLDLDDQGRGEAEYRVDAGGHQLTFLAFTTTLDESEHTDRVVAERWEISGCLVDGVVDRPLTTALRTQVPLQERGRLDPRVLVLTRGNRSVRFFDELVDALASGSQPDPDRVADAGYIMRSTAFYANGKFGMRAFEGIADDHPLRAPYRAQFVCAWLFRELSYDVVEHCARRRGGSAAVRFGPQWRCYFGLGNATGLGLVPFAFKHPLVLDAWAGIRERALADVRATCGTPWLLARLRWWIARAERHFATGADDDRTPFRNQRETAAVARRVAVALDEVEASERPFDALYRWAAGHDPETVELVVSLLIELDDADDRVIDGHLDVDEHATTDPPMTVAEAIAALGDRYRWLDELDLGAGDADGFCWVVSDNNEEPRRVMRSALLDELPDAARREVRIDVALQMWRLRRALRDADPDGTFAQFVLRNPEHRMAASRLARAVRPYCEPRDNACAGRFLPLQLQRFQLAMYGMDNFTPKSTDWLRVTLFQGAPRIDDLRPGLPDEWVFPARPERERVGAR